MNRPDWNSHDCLPGKGKHSPDRQQATWTGAATCMLTPTKIAGRQQGIALVIVLWLIVLLTVIGSSHARNVHIETRLAFNHLNTARAHALAESGINYAILELFNTNITERWLFDGSVNTLDLDQGTVAVSIRPASGLLDLNAGEAIQFDAVLASAGLDDSARPELVDAILDWRDLDHLRHLHGAEDSDYRHAGYDWGARDGPFASVDELRYVLGMTNELFTRLAPYLTVFSGASEVDLEVAPAWLYAALTGSDRELATDSPLSAAAAAGAYHINAMATTSTGSNAHLEAVVITTPSRDLPYTILGWRLPVAAENNGT